MNIPLLTVLQQQTEKQFYNIKDYLIYQCKKKMHVTRVKTVFKMFNPIQSQVSSFYNGK